MTTEHQEHRQDGVYSSEGREFTRDSHYITDRIVADPSVDGEHPVEPGRYRLVVARACPWAHRSTIVRELLGLGDVISMGVCGPTHDADSWTFDLDPGGIDPVLRIPRLKGDRTRRVRCAPRHLRP